MPAKTLFKKNLLIAIQTWLFWLFMCSIVFGDTSGGIHWQILETENTIIRYQSQADLEIFHHKSKYRVEDLSLKRLMASSNPDYLTSILQEKKDNLFERVREILDMHKRMEKVIVDICHDEKQLHETYQGLYMQPCNIRAWYEYRYNTIYINLADIHEGMLAHELAHGIIDHYMVIRPPRATAEILAPYVDSHLKR